MLTFTKKCLPSLPLRPACRTGLGCRRPFRSSPFSQILMGEGGESNASRENKRAKGSAAQTLRPRRYTKSAPNDGTSQLKRASLSNMKKGLHYCCLSSSLREEQEGTKLEACQHGGEKLHPVVHWRGCAAPSETGRGIWQRRGWTEVATRSNKP